MRGILGAEVALLRAEPATPRPSDPPAAEPRGATTLVPRALGRLELPLVAHPAPEVALPWILRLRWVAVAGQTSTLLLVDRFLQAELPWTPLLGTIAVTVLTNLALGWMVRRRRLPRGPVVPAVLGLDTLLLTSLLHWCGGPSNPFAILYLVHVAMAVVAGSPRWTWTMVELSAACYGLLFWSHVPLRVGGRPLGLDLYLQGSWFAVLLVSLVIALFIGRVVVELRARDEQLAGLRALAERNERLASLTTLAAGAAHELGTPLGTIAVVARELELAAARQPDGADLSEDARLIRSQVDRCRQILDRLRARGDEGDEEGRGPEPLAPAELLALVRAELGGLPDGAVRLRVQAGLERVIVPRASLVPALAPLVRNALDATGGAPIELGLERQQGLLAFEVRDTGPGMSPEELQRAGEPFFTTKPAGRGTGLGLYVVRLLAERLGGELRLSSSPGQGTTARLQFPEAA